MEIREVSLSELPEVYHLTYEAYREEHHVDERANGELRYGAQFDAIPQTKVFGVFDATAKLVGTVSFTLDTAAGLPVDHDFPAIVSVIRAFCNDYGLQLAACWRAVTDKSSHSLFDILMPLISATVREFCSSNTHLVLFEVHPHHAPAYQRLLGISPVAQGICEGVAHRPAVLMLGDGRKIQKRWMRVGGWGDPDLVWPVWPEGVPTWNPF